MLRPVTTQCCARGPSDLPCTLLIRWLVSIGCVAAFVAAAVLNADFGWRQPSDGYSVLELRCPGGQSSPPALWVRENWRDSRSSTQTNGGLVEPGVAQCNISHKSAVDLTSVHCPHVLSRVQSGSRRVRDGRFQPRSSDGTPCSIHWYNSSEACDLLQRSDRYIVGIGDSLMRHLLQAIYTILSGNFKHGGMMHWELCPNDVLACTCDVAFTDWGGGERCRDHSMARYAGPQSAICPNWRKPYLQPWLDWATAKSFSRPLLSSILKDNTFVPQFFDGRALVLVNPALHESFNSELLLSHIYDAAYDVTQSTGQDVVMLPVTMPAPQLNKPERFWAKQGPEAVNRWNSILKSWAAQRHLDVFDTHAVTLNASSYDGTHFASSVNVLLAQVLLNYIAELDGVRGEASA